MVTLSPSKAALRVQIPLSAPKNANMAKQENAADLKSVGGNTLWVQVPLLAPLVPPPGTINRTYSGKQKQVGKLKGETPFGQGWA